MIKINIFKIIKKFIICVNKNIVKIKYNYACLQSNHFLKKKVIINVKISKWNNFFNLNEV